MSKVESNKNFTFKQYAWQQFKKNRAALVSFYILVLLVVMAVLAPLLANHHPLYVKYHGERLYPAFSTLFDEAKSVTIVDEKTNEEIVINYELVDWRTLELDNVWWPIVAYSPNTIDKYNRDYAHPNFEQRLKDHTGKIVELPGRIRHFLGTDKLGRDVASGLIHGARVSLLVGVVSMGIAAIIGVLLGALAGFYGDTEMKTSRIQYWFALTGVFLGYFLAFVSRSLILSEAFDSGLLIGLSQLFFSLIIWVGVIVLFYQISKPFKRISFLGVEVSVPVDSIVSRAIEVLNSLPILILIISVSALLSEKSLWVLMVIIGLTGWTGIARFMRAEMLRIRQMEYIQAGKVLGFSNWRIISKHAIPNGLAPVFVSFAFGVAAAILTESGLSFLGIGVPDDIVTWGSMLSAGRQEFEAWWLVIYPGLAIFITITVYNLIGEGLRDALDPKQKK